MPPAPVLVPFDRLHDFVARIFRAVGFSEAHATIEADVLTWANLRGVESHGIFRVPSYVAAIRSGDINPQPDIRVVHSVGASSIIEGDRGAGAIAMTFAMERAVSLAREHAVGWALLRNTTHTGPMGYYARAAADAGMIGIVASASKPLMAYHGTRVPTVSTNPLAIAAPRAGAPPLTADMATAAIAWGKLAQARRSGAALPENVALDATGKVTTDSSEAVVPLPLAGPRGAGLSLMIECVTSLLAGVPLIAPPLLAGTGGAAQWQHGLAVAVDIAAFTDLDRFAADAAELAEAVKQQPRADGFDEVFAPGERGDAVLDERKKNGVPMPPEQWRALVETAESLEVETPTPE
jgi:ureidoglycolate dehydrogenase (NAD+)